MPLTLNAIFARLDQEAAAGISVLGWRMTQAELEALWKEMHYSWQRDKPLPIYRPGWIYEICGRPVTIVATGPAVAIIRTPGLLGFNQAVPVC